MTPEMGTFIVAIFTLFVFVWQVRIYSRQREIMDKQRELMVGQKDLMETQTTIMGEQTETARQQANYMRAGLDETKKAADAAKKSADVAEESSIASRRAYVLHRGFVTNSMHECEPVTRENFMGLRITPTLENFGTLPALGARSQTFKIWAPRTAEMNAPHEAAGFTPTMLLPSGMTIPPGGIYNAPQAIITAAELQMLSKNKVVLFIHIFTEYIEMHADRPTRTTSVCVGVLLTGDPANPDHSGQNPPLTFEFGPKEHNHAN